MWQSRFTLYKKFFFFIFLAKIVNFADPWFLSPFYSSYIAFFVLCIVLLLLFRSFWSFLTQPRTTHKKQQFNTPKNTQNGCADRVCIVIKGINAKAAGSIREQANVADLQPDILVDKLISIIPGSTNANVE